MANFLYVDNSNVWIEGMHVAAAVRGLAPDVWSAVTNKICVSLGRWISGSCMNLLEVTK